MSQALSLAEHWRGVVPKVQGTRVVEVALAVLTLLLYSQALLGPLLTVQNDPDGSPLLRLMWPPIYAVTLLLIAFNPVQIWRTALRAWPITLLCILPLVSTLWSIDPGLSLRRGLAVLMSGVFGLWLASRFSWRDIARLIAFVFLILGFGSIIAAVLFPGFGVDQDVHAGAWKGLWWEKNTLGSMFALASLGAICAMFLAERRMERQFWGVMVLVFVGLVLMSTSRTALVACLVSVLGPCAIWVARRGFGFAAIAIFAGILGVSCLGLVLVIGPGVILDALGRDATLTGRTDIWAALSRAIAEAPMTGYGFGAFWQDDDGPGFWVRQYTQWDVPTAHNAWLETAIALGLPATVFAGLCVLFGFATALLRLLSGPSALWALPFLTAWLIVSMSESNFLVPNSLSWALLAATLAKLMSERD